MSRLSVFGDVLTSFVCKLGAYFGYLSLSLSVSLMLISVDRFVAIVFPMKVSMISGRLRSIFILLSWVFSLVFFIPAWFEVRLYFLPLIIIAILNICIINLLRKSNPVIQGNSLSSATRHKGNQRIMKMLILIIVFFFLCYTPKYTFLAIWVFTSDMQLYKVQIFYIFALFFLPFLSTFFNPVIIFSLSTNYRQALKNYLRVVCGMCQSCFKSNQSAFEENVELPEMRVQP